MIIEYAGIRCKALNPCKKYQFLITQASVPSYFLYMHKKQIPIKSEFV